MPDKSLEGKIAVITGASKGLGKAMAAALGQAGARLALISRNAELLRGTAEELRKTGIEAETFIADITDESEVARVRDAILARFGGVDILINNAGINIRKPVTDFTLDEWNQVIQTNLTGPFLACRAFVPIMKGRGYGRIINMTSMMSHISLPGRTAYSASKAGLLGFTRALALELAPEGITVTGISPGPIATEMNAPVLQDPQLSRQFTSKIPLGRWGKVEEIGKLALYLCSEEAGFLTGTDIIIDGGWSTQ